ncbi:MAG: GumC family protein [Rhodospirillales bacterium]
MRGKIFANALAVLWAAWRRRYLIAAPILFMPLVALAVGLLTPKTYKTYTTILVQETAQQNQFLQDLTVSTNLRKRMAALSALLHSRHILSGVAMKVGLIDEDVSPEDLQWRITRLSKGLGVKLVGDDLVQITYSAEDPSKMAEVLELVSKRFVERIVAPQQSSINNSESFLEDEFDRRRTDLEEAEAELAEYKSAFTGEMPEMRAAVISRIGATQDQLIQKRAEYQGAQAELADLQDRVFNTNPVANEIEELIVDVMSKLAVLRSRYTGRHTKVQAAERRLKSLEDERAKVLAAGRNRNAGDFERLSGRASNAASKGADQTQPLLLAQIDRLQRVEGRAKGLKKEISMLAGELVSMQEKISGGGGVHARRLSELQRDLGVKQKIFEDIAERHQMARLTGSLGRAGDQERVKLIDPPFTPLAPANMPPGAFAAMGVLAGIMLGAGLAVCAELLDLTVRLRAPLERIAGAPVLTRIPLLTHDSPGAGDEAPPVFSPETNDFTNAEPGHV